LNHGVLTLWGFCRAASCGFSRLAESYPYCLAPLTMRLVFEVSDGLADAEPAPVIGVGHLDLDPLLLTRPSLVGTRGGVLVMERSDVVDLTNRAGTKPCGQLAVRLRVARCAPPE
jgi:hypothetical protein